MPDAEYGGGNNNSGYGTGGTKAGGGTQNDSRESNNSHDSPGNGGGGQGSQSNGRDDGMRDSVGANAPSGSSLGGGGDGEGGVGGVDGVGGGGLGGGINGGGGVGGGTFGNPLGTASTSAQQLGLVNKMNTSDRALMDAVGNIQSRTGIDTVSAIEFANDMARTAYGELGSQYANEVNLAAINQVGLNRLGLMDSNGSYGGTPEGVLKGFDANGFDQPRVSKNGVGPEGNEAYQEAGFATQAYEDAIQSLKERTAGTGVSLPDAVNNATNYRATSMGKPSWGPADDRKNFSETVLGPHAFSNPDPGRTASVVSSNTAAGQQPTVTMAASAPPPKTTVASISKPYVTAAINDIKAVPGTAVDLVNSLFGSNIPKPQPKPTPPSAREDIDVWGPDYPQDPSIAGRVAPPARENIDVWGPDYPQDPSIAGRLGQTATLDGIIDAARRSLDLSAQREEEMRIAHPNLDAQNYGFSAPEEEIRAQNYGFQSPSQNPLEAAAAVDMTMAPFSNLKDKTEREQSAFQQPNTTVVTQSPSVLGQPAVRSRSPAPAAPATPVSYEPQNYGFVSPPADRPRALGADQYGDPDGIQNIIDNNDVFSGLETPEDYLGDFRGPVGWAETGIRPGFGYDPTNDYSPAAQAARESLSGVPSESMERAEPAPPGTPEYEAAWAKYNNLRLSRTGMPTIPRTTGTKVTGALIDGVLGKVPIAGQLNLIAKVFGKSVGSLAMEDMDRWNNMNPDEKASAIARAHLRDEMRDDRGGDNTGPTNGGIWPPGSAGGGTTAPPDTGQNVDTSWTPSPFLGLPTDFENYGQGGEHRFY